MNKGVSLIETVLALLVFAILIHIGLLSFRRLESGYRLQAAVWEVLSRLNQARFRAIRDGTPVRVEFLDGHCRLEEWDEETKTWLMRDSSALSGVTMRANNTPVFYPEGTVSNLATIFIANERGSYKVTLAITGRVKAAPL